MERHEPRRGTMALALAMQAPAVAMAAPVPTPAPTQTVDVTWHAPASCPDQSAARAEIMQRLSDRPARGVRAVARVRALDDGTWEVNVQLHTEDGRAMRTLQATSCAEALTATAVVLAIAVDPEQETIERPPPNGAVPPPPDDAMPPPSDPPVIGPPPEPTPEPPPEPTQPRTDLLAEPSSVPEPDPTPADAGPRSLGISVGVRGGIDYGALPSAAAHVAASVGLWGQRWIVEAGPVHRIRTEASAALPVPAGGRFRLTAGHLRAGLRLRRGTLELPLVAGVEMGTIWARGTGAVDPIEVRRLWAAAIASAGIGWAPVDAFAVQLGVDGLVSLARPTFTLGDEIEVLTVGPVSIRAWLGVAGRFAL